jgi:tetratricopeptide (TPR) repeat protein
MDAKEYEKAITILQNHFNFVNKETPVFTSFCLLLGLCFYEISKYENALNVYKQAPLLRRKMDSNLLILHYCVGNTYEKMNDKKNALKHYNKVYSENINFLDVSDRINNLS